MSKTAHSIPRVDLVTGERFVEEIYPTMDRRIAAAVCPFGHDVSNGNYYVVTPARAEAQYMIPQWAADLVVCPTCGVAFVFQGELERAKKKLEQCRARRPKQA